MKNERLLPLLLVIVLANGCASSVCPPHAEDAVMHMKHYGGFGVRSFRLETVDLWSDGTISITAWGKRHGCAALSAKDYERLVSLLPAAVAVGDRYFVDDARFIYLQTPGGKATWHPSGNPSQDPAAAVSLVAELDRVLSTHLPRLYDRTLKR